MIVWAGVVIVMIHPHMVQGWTVCGFFWYGAERVKDHTQTMMMVLSEI